MKVCLVSSSSASNSNRSCSNSITIILTLVLSILLLPRDVSARSILAIANETAELSTLARLVSTNAMVSSLLDAANSTNVTVLAPTNNAFATLMPSDLATKVTTGAGWAAHLESLLKNHIISGQMPYSSIISGTAVLTTLTGEMLTTTAIDSNNITIDGATVIMADILADNGIVHIVDRVITPAWWEKTLFPVAASELEDISVFVGLWEESPTTTSVLVNGTYTIFAPTNNAFTNLGDLTVGCVTQNATVLAAVLTYHSLDVVMPASQIVTTSDLTTLEGSLLQLDATALTINGGATITRPDALLANNGILHVIDAVLVPDTVLPFIEQCVTDATRAPVAAKTTRVPTMAPMTSSVAAGRSTSIETVLLVALVALLLGESFIDRW
jgi:transforming growth factor-beta-induced protein